MSTRPEGESLVVEAHCHEETEVPRVRSTAIQSERTRGRLPLDLGGQLDRATKQQQFLGCQMIAKARRRKISWVRSLLNLPCLLKARRSQGGWVGRLQKGETSM
jgi:hypothetical protein